MHINNHGPVKPAPDQKNSRRDLHVECYSGYRAEETPRRFKAGSMQIEIIEIISRWQTPDARFFKIRGNDGNAYTLKHDGRHWSLE